MPVLAPELGERENLYGLFANVNIVIEKRISSSEEKYGFIRLPKARPWSQHVRYYSVLGARLARLPAWGNRVKERNKEAFALSFLITLTSSDGTPKLHRNLPKSVYGRSRGHNIKKY